MQLPLLNVEKMCGREEIGALMHNMASYGGSPQETTVLNVHLLIGFLAVARSVSWWTFEVFPSYFPDADLVPEDMPLEDLIAYVAVFEDAEERLAPTRQGSRHDRIRADAARAREHIRETHDAEAVERVLRTAYNLYVTDAVNAYSAMLDNAHDERQQGDSTIGEDYAEWRRAIRRIAAAIGYEFSDAQEAVLGLIPEAG